MPYLEKFPSKRTNEVEFEREAQEPLGVGLGEGDVNRIVVRVFNKEGKHRDITMAEKIFNSPSPRKISLERILQNHTELKERKLPVLPTMRIEKKDGPDALYMTDLSANGKNEVISVFDWGEAYGRKGKFREKGPKEFSLSNAPDLSKKLAEIYRQTTEAGVILRTPDIFFLVINKESKRADVVFGDISSVDFVPTEKKIADPIKPIMGDTNKIEERNHRIFSDFIRRMNSHLDNESELDSRHLDEEYISLQEKLRSESTEE